MAGLKGPSLVAILQLDSAVSPAANQPLRVGRAGFAAADGRAMWSSDLAGRGIEANRGPIVAPGPGKAILVSGDFGGLLEVVTNTGAFLWNWTDTSNGGRLRPLQDSCSAVATAGSIIVASRSGLITSLRVPSPDPAPTPPVPPASHARGLTVRVAWALTITAMVVLFLVALGCQIRARQARSVGYSSLT